MRCGDVNSMNRWERKRPGEEWQRRTFGRSTRDAVRTCHCVTCEAPDFNWRSDKERREYGISGMCRTCQGAVFGGAK